MILKHKSEWPVLVDIARKCNLDNDQTVLLLAYREVLNGVAGVEFNKLNALEKGLSIQAILMAKEIKDKEYFYQAYLKRLGPYDYVKDFIEYLDESNAYKLKKYIDLIIKEFTL